MGWSQPVFQGKVSNASFPSSGVGFLDPLGGLGGVAGSTILDFLTKGFGTNIKDMLQRAGLIILGGILLTIGFFQIQEKSLKAVVAGPMDARKTAKKTASKTADDSANEATEQVETEAEVE